MQSQASSLHPFRWPSRGYWHQGAVALPPSGYGTEGKVWSGWYVCDTLSVGHSLMAPAAQPKTAPIAASAGTLKQGLQVEKPTS